MDAFGQHYSLRWAAEHPPLLDDPWVAWGRAVAIGFPGAHSIGGALLTNPREFLHHVVGNLYEYPGLLVSLAASPALPGRVVGPAILSGLFLAVAVRRRWPQPVAWRTSTLLLAACASVLPSLLVKPKAVYALPLVLLILIGMARVARSLLGTTSAERSRLGLATCVAATLALWLVPLLPPAVLPVASAVAELRAFGRDRDRVRNGGCWKPMAAGARTWTRINARPCCCTRSPRARPSPNICMR